MITDSEAEPEPPSHIEPGLALEWDEILRRALARDPAHRYQSAEEFLNAIDQLDQPTGVADLPLPHLRTLGIGAAIFVGLALAIVAAPSFPRFRAVAPLSDTLGAAAHPPPRFATDKTLAAQQTARVTTPPIAKPAKIQRMRYAARSTEIDALAPRPRLIVPTNSPTPADATPSAAIVAPVAGAEAVDEPLPSDTAEPSVPQASTPAKRGFWSRMNVFKRKSADEKEKQ